MEPFISQICLFAFNFNPKSWQQCNGQLMQISQNTALFSLLGTTFGGNGVQTFGLPNLQSRVPIGMGNGSVLTPYAIGQLVGAENTTLLISNMPQHTHTINAVSDLGNVSTPTGAYLANTGVLDPEYKTNGTNTVMNPGVIGNTGGNVPINNLQPYLVLNYCIAVAGIFPSRN